MTSTYQCCYCAQGIAQVGDDPVSIVLRTGPDREASQHLWAHALCVFRMVRSAPLNLVLPEELELLPRELALQSASPSEVVLPYLQAIEALKVYAGARKRVLGWEGWIRTPDGTVGHANPPMGTADLSKLDVQSAMATCRRTIDDAHSAWSASVSSHDAELLFCITVAAAYPAVAADERTNHRHRILISVRCVRS